MTPEQFGLYVQSHPDSLMVTAANKMRMGQKISVSQNLTGKLMESWKVPTARGPNEDNEKLISKFWSDGFGKSVTPTTKGWVVHDVDQEIMQDFIGAFKIHKDFAPIKALIMSYLDQIKDVHPVADVLLISGDKGGESETNFTLGAQERVAATKGVKDGGWILNKYRVASRGDEKLGLTPTQLAAAVANAAADETNQSKDKAPSDYHYRVVRKKPLLMVHVLAPTGNPDVTGRIPAFGVSFPDGLFGRTVEIVANKLWIEQMYGPMNDDPDEEEDYDE